MKPAVIEGPGLFIGADTLAAMRHVIRRELEAARRDSVDLSPDVLESLERIVVHGDAWAANSKQHRVSPNVSSVDSRDFAPVEWTNVGHAAKELKISPQAVTGLLRRGSLHGQLSGRSWRVCTAAVAARKEGSTCPH